MKPHLEERSTILTLPTDITVFLERYKPIAASDTDEVPRKKRGRNLSKKGLAHLMLHAPATFIDISAPAAGLRDNFLMFMAQSDHPQISQSVCLYHGTSKTCFAFL
ncbi:hypothetical protein WA026_014217 [Henosepilachna vigintioctopunctata]|uniref:Uncharacterized protein n=1 Tax=Henosepilachna vigintioctopunctata TaxID=420089 RepID=A0AAW1TTW4_9CUCU